MADDIRVSLSFRHHRKRKRLLLRLGEKGVVALIDLWCTVAEQNPSGYLENYSMEDIEIDSGWTGDPGELVKALLDIGFLENSENGFCLHNWKKRQSWVANASERSNISRFNRMSKTHNAIYKELQSMDIRSISRENYDLLTSAQRPLKRSLVIFNNRLTNALSDCSENLSPGPGPGPGPVPVPSPAPAPTKKPPQPENQKFNPPVSKKKTPGKTPGINLQKNNAVKNGDFSVNLSETFLKINSDCRAILELPKDSKRKQAFDPKKWAQKQISSSKHPGAVSRALDGLKMYWGRSRDPWAYADNILGKVNGNFNEQESVAIHEKLKGMNGDPDLLTLTSGLFQNLDDF